MKKMIMATLAAAVFSITGCSKEQIQNNVTLPQGCTVHAGTYYFNEDHRLDDAVGISRVSCENAKHNWYHTYGPPRDRSFVEGQSGTPDPTTKLLN